MGKLVELHAIRFNLHPVFMFELPNFSSTWNHITNLVSVYEDVGREIKSLISEYKPEWYWDYKGI